MLGGIPEFTLILRKVKEQEMSTSKTSSRIASKAASALKDKQASSNTKSMAASALAQAQTIKGTTASAARVAARTLANPRSSKSAKQIAASVLSQKKEPFPVKTYKVAGSSLTQKASASVVRKVAKKSVK